MADAAARREARRRKILQNSEARLKRLAGIEHTTQDTHNEEAKETESIEKASPTTLLQASVKTTRNEDNIQLKTSNRQETNRPSEERFVNRITEELTRDEDTTATRDIIRTTSKNTELKTQESQDSNIPEVLNGVNVGLSGAESRVQEDDGGLSEEGCWSGHTKHMYLLVFAVLVRCLLACEQLQVIVMKSAVIPFLMLQCCVVGFDFLIRKGSQTTQPTMSLLSTALVLTGVSKTTITMRSMPQEPPLALPEEHAPGTPLGPSRGACPRNPPWPSHSSNECGRQTAHGDSPDMV